MVKRLALVALMVAPGCSLAQTTSAPASTPAADRAVRTLQHARFGPYVGDVSRPLLRDIHCAAVSSSRIRCHATWDARRKQIVFGVKRDGSLYVIVAGPLAIS